MAIPTVTPMVNLSEFLNSITPYARSVAIPTVYRAVRDAIGEMCEKTRVWRHEEEYAVASGEDIVVSAPDGAVLIDIEHASYNGQKLTSKTVAWLDENMNGWRDNLITGTSNYMTQVGLNTLRLVPGEDGEVLVSMWLKPSQDCTEVPDYFAAQFRETIAHGALARILAIPGQPYTDLNMAGANKGIFDGRLVGKKNLGELGQQRATVRVKAHPY